MDISQLIALGSKTAKDGFKNEDDVVEHFNNWEKDELAREWLTILGHDIGQVESVKASKAPPRQKADVQVSVQVAGVESPVLHNIQVKLASNRRGFNQIDKRWVDKYVELWNIPQHLTLLLKQFTGELPNTINKYDDRRTLITEMNDSDQHEIVNFFKNSQTQIVSDILKGRGEYSADWVLVILKSKGVSSWVLKSINEAMNTLGSGEVVITDRGSLRIGRVLMQRKGGDGGRKSAQMLQFKVNPVELFDK